MILKASQRGNGAQLARHLMNDFDNDHITLHEVRGFMAKDLMGAFNEADAISKATCCKQFLFSVSFNPLGQESVSVDDFITAINRAEEVLGLTDQPRAVVFHEKEGRRHAHAVWSRIDAAEMKAINMSFFKTRLNKLSKDLYLENNWELPRGYQENWKNPLNYSLAEFQQAKRIGVEDPREIKQVFHQTFIGSDNLGAFKSALEDSGYYLAKGDRRGIVAVDLHGKIYSVARYAGIKTKELRVKFPDTGHLLSVDETQDMIKKNLSHKMREFMAEQRTQFKEDMRPLMLEKKVLVANHRIERAKLKRAQVIRHRQESKARAAHYRTGILGIFDLLVGKKREVKKQNEIDLARCKKRDLAEREALFHAQHKMRKTLQIRIAAMRANEISKRKKLTNKMADVLNIKRNLQREPGQFHQPNRRRGKNRDDGFEFSMR